MAAIVKMLGEELKGKDGLKVQTETITKKNVNEGVIGLYFSAHWCPPCKAFTPILSEFYNKFKTENASTGKYLELVFVSSDRDETQFNEYFATMPFLALPYQDRDRKVCIGIWQKYYSLLHTIGPLSYATLR